MCAKHEFFSDPWPPPSSPPNLAAVEAKCGPDLLKVLNLLGAWGLGGGGSWVRGDGGGGSGLSLSAPHAATNDECNLNELNLDQCFSSRAISQRIYRTSCLTHPGIGIKGNVKYLGIIVGHRGRP